MKLFFILGSLNKGGAERVISKLANHYSSLGDEVFIITLLYDGVEYPLNSSITVIPVHHNKPRVLSFFPWIFSLRKLCKKYKPDAIVSFAGRINGVALLALPFCRCVVSERNDPRKDGRGKITMFALNWLYCFSARKVVFQNKEIQNLFWKGVQRKSVIIPNPVSVPEQHQNKIPFSCVMVGRLVEQKNQILACEAFKKILVSFPLATLRIYGDGDERGFLQDFIDKNGLGNSIFLLGVSDDVFSEMSKATVYLLTSLYEGLSNSLLEALALGLPCISTKVSGSNEYIVDGENGFLVDTNVDSVASSLIFLFSHPEEAEEMGRKAKDQSARYSDKEVFKMWDGILWR